MDSGRPGYFAITFSSGIYWVSGGFACNVAILGYTCTEKFTSLGISFLCSVSEVNFHLYFNYNIL